MLLAPAYPVAIYIAGRSLATHEQHIAGHGIQGSPQIDLISPSTIMLWLP